MTFVLGREAGVDAGPVGRLGAYRALDGSDGAPLYLDVDGPHAALVVGKRGYGKSYTLGVFAEFLARTPGVAPVVVDPMGVFAPIASDEGAAGGPSIPATLVAEPSVAPTALDPRSWCALLSLDPESGAGSLVWRATQTGESLSAMRKSVDDADAPTRDRRAAINHLALAESWGVFDDEGLSAQDLAGGELTVVDVSGLDPAPMNAIARGIGEVLYRMRVDETVERLPWLLVDEAHTFFDGVARDALERILTRGRAPGVSLVLATQRPGAVPPVAISQSDILVAHRLTAQTDLDALERARPTYLTTSLEAQLPSVPGEVVVVDDATETVHTAQVRQRQTPHGGDNPSVSDRSREDTPGGHR